MPKIGFQDQLSLNAGQKYILSTIINLSFFIKIFICSMFEWLFIQVLLYGKICRVAVIAVGLEIGWTIEQFFKS